MGEKKQFDFNRYRLPAVSKGYILRLAIYIVVLILLAVLYNSLYVERQEKIQPLEEVQIKEIKIQE